MSSGRPRARSSPRRAETRVPALAGSTKVRWSSPIPSPRSPLSRLVRSAELAQKVSYNPAIGWLGLPNAGDAFAQLLSRHRERAGRDEALGELDNEGSRHLRMDT